MLILTSDALDPSCHIPEWSDTRVVVRSLDRSAQSTAIEEFPQDVVLADYLQPATSATQIICDLALWLKHRFSKNTRPLMYFDRPVNRDEILTLANLSQNTPLAFTTEFDETDRLVMLCLGQGISQSPLLPEFLDFVRNHGQVDDRTMTNLLGQTFAWT